MEVGARAAVAGVGFFTRSSNLEGKKTTIDISEQEMQLFVLLSIVE